MFAGCVYYILAHLFLSLNESPYQITKNVFYFTSTVLFVLKKIKFQDFLFSNFMTSSTALQIIFKVNLSDDQKNRNLPGHIKLLAVK